MAKFELPKKKKIVRSLVLLILFKSLEGPNPLTALLLTPNFEPTGGIASKNEMASVKRKLFKKPYLISFDNHRQDKLSFNRNTLFDGWIYFWKIY